MQFMPIPLSSRNIAEEEMERLQKSEDRIHRYRMFFFGGGHKEAMDFLTMLACTRPGEDQVPQPYFLEYGGINKIQFI